MSTQIQFQSFNFQSSAVRIITDTTGEHWFCGADVCDILGYTNSRKVLQDHCKQGGVTKRYTPTQSGNQEMVFINEPNLYRLIIKSRMPAAEQFEAWVFEEVLPQIRKTGRYSQTSAQIAPLADEEALPIIIKLYTLLNYAYEMSDTVLKQHPNLADQIANHIGGQYLYTLHRPAKNGLDDAKAFVQAKSERISYVRGMLSLLDNH